MEFLSGRKIDELEDLGLEIKNKVRIYADEKYAASLSVWKEFDFIALRSSDISAAGIVISHEKVDGKTFITDAATSDAIQDAMKEKGFIMKTSEDDSGVFSTYIYSKGYPLLKSKGKSEISSIYFAVKSVISPIKVICSVEKEAARVSKDGGVFPLVLNNRSLKDGDMLSSRGGNRRGNRAWLFRIAGKYGTSDDFAVYLASVCNGVMDVSDLQSGCELYMVMAPMKEENK